MCAINESANAVVQITVDSGASKSVWPMTRKGVTRTKSKKNIKLVAANGTSIAVKGDAELRFQGPSGNRRSMKFLDADVKKAIGLSELHGGSREPSRVWRGGPVRRACRERHWSGRRECSSWK